MDPEEQRIKLCAIDAQIEIAQQNIKNNLSIDEQNKEFNENFEKEQKRLAIEILDKKLLDEEENIKKGIIKNPKRRFLCTLWQDVEHCYKMWEEKWEFINQQGISCLWYQGEMGKLAKDDQSEKLHLQIYIECENPKSWQRIQKILGDVTTLHFVPGEIKYPKKAMEYCVKNDTRHLPPIRLGQMKQQGKRNDLDKVCQALKEGKGVNEIKNEYPETYTMYHTNINKVAKEFEEDLKPNVFTHKKVNIHLITGLAGSGKSSGPYLKHGPKNVGKICKPTGREQLWFDDCSDTNGKCKPILIIDEFDEAYISYKYLLSLTDGTPMKIPIKHGFLEKSWTDIYIISNNQPNEWYNDINVLTEESFVRRVDTWDKKTLQQDSVNKHKIKILVDGKLKEEVDKTTFIKKFNKDNLACVIDLTDLSNIPDIRIDI